MPQALPAVSNSNATWNSCRTVRGRWIQATLPLTRRGGWPGSGCGTSRFTHIFFRT